MKSTRMCRGILGDNIQGPVVQRLDNAIQRISVNKTNHAIRWIVIYPVDSAIQPLNNRGQDYSAVEADYCTFLTFYH